MGIVCPFLAAPLVVAVVVAAVLAAESSFSCKDRPYGYYADLEAECQVFHICNNNVKWTFHCPNQTLFNQVRLLRLPDTHLLACCSSQI